MTRKRAVVVAALVSVVCAVGAWAQSVFESPPLLPARDIVSPKMLNGP